MDKTDQWDQMDYQDSKDLKETREVKGRLGSKGTEVPWATKDRRGTLDLRAEEESEDFQEQSSQMNDSLIFYMKKNITKNIYLSLNHGLTNLDTYFE